MLIYHQWGPWHYSEGNFAGDTSATNQLNEFDNYSSKISSSLPGTSELKFGYEAIITFDRKLCMKLLCTFIVSANLCIMTSSNGNISVLLPFVRGIHRSTVNSPHRGQWRGALMFSLIGVWINGWVNNREAGDFRRYRAHYDVTVMYF